MEKRRRRMGIISCLVLLSILIIVFVNVSIPYLTSVLPYFDLLLMVLYAVVPCVPAVILRVKFRRDAAKQIAVFATVIVGVCCLIMLTNAAALLDNNEWISYFAQYALASSVPVLYCVAFFGIKREIWVALAPSLLYLLTFLLSEMIMNGFAGLIDLILSPYILMAILMSVGFAIWASLCVFISLMIHMVLSHPKIKNAIKINKKIEIITIVSMGLLVLPITVVIIQSLPLYQSPEPVFEISLSSDEFHGEYNFEITQGGIHNIFIRSESRDVVGTVYIATELGIIYSASDEMITVDQPMALATGIYTVTVDLNPIEWKDEREIIPVAFHMIIKPLFASDKSKQR